MGIRNHRAWRGASGESSKQCRSELMCQFLQDMYQLLSFESVER